MAASDARPVPKKNVAYRHYFAVRKNDGTLITTWTGQDSEVDKDGAGFSDCTNEATEIGTTGVGYLDLTSTEMNADAVNVKITVTNTDALPYVVTLFPEEAGDIRVDMTQLGSDTQSATDLKDFADAGYDPSTNKVQGVVLTDTLTTYTGNTPQTGDAFARLGAPAGASVSADVAAVKTQTAAIETDTQDIQSRLPAALVSGRMDSNMQAAANNVITAGVLADGAIDAATFAADTVLAPVRTGTAQAGGASTITLDASASATNDWYNDRLIYITGGTGAGQVAWVTDYVGATKVTTIAPAWITQPDNTSTFAILPAASVFHQVLADHVVSGSVGAGINSASSAGDPWATALPGAYTSGQAGKIIGDNVNATISSRASQTSVDTIDDFLDTEIAAIKAKTDNLPADPADASDIAASFTTVNTKLDTIDDLLDTEVAAIKSVVDAILVDTAEIGAAGAGLTNINLPNQTMDITGNITGNLSGSVGSVTGAVGSVTRKVGGNVAGSVGSVTGAVGSVTGNVGGNVTGSVGSLATQAKADVNAEVLDVLSVDTFGEPTGTPGATLTLREKIGWLFMALRNKVTITSSKKTFYDDSDAAEWEKDLSDDGTTYTESEGNAP